MAHARPEDVVTLHWFYETGPGDAVGYIVDREGRQVEVVRIPATGDDLPPAP